MVPCLHKEGFLHFLYACPFDYTTFVVTVVSRLESCKTGLTTPVRWLSLLQLKMLSRSAIIVQSELLVAFFLFLFVYGLLSKTEFVGFFLSSLPHLAGHWFKLPTTFL